MMLQRISLTGYFLEIAWRGQRGLPVVVPSSGAHTWEWKDIRRTHL